MFLPSLHNSSDAFWSGLDYEIQDLMKKAPVLRSRNRNNLRLISDVLIPVTNLMDKNGQPVLDDPANDLYLSPKYPQNVVNILFDYGLKRMAALTVVGLLETDLRSADSKMHGRHTTDEWHSAVARMFCEWHDMNFNLVKQRLRLLPLLPLRDDKWTSTVSGPVYFSTTGDINIPDSLDLRVISPLASEDPDRKTLFRHLGASEATIDQVRASIFRVFNSNSPRSFQILKGYLDYLYLTHQPGTHTREGYANTAVVTDDWKRTFPRHTDIYLPNSKHPYSPVSLLAAQGTAPGLAVTFLYSGHMDHVPERPNSSHPTWERWLCDFIGLRERLRLLSRNGDALSDTFLYVCEHRPDKFLGLFEHLWLHEKSNFLRNPTLRSKIEDLPAKDLCGVNFALKLPETWLPFKHLRDSVKRYMEHPEQFPFLKFEESEMTEQFGARWNFLNEYFSVGKDNSVEFLLEILRCIERSCPESSSDHQTKMVFELYVAIYAKLSVAHDEPGARRKIR